jgi:hypothetical protein
MDLFQSANIKLDPSQRQTGEANTQKKPNYNPLVGASKTKRGYSINL